MGFGAFHKGVFPSLISSSFLDLSEVALVYIVDETVPDSWRVKNADDMVTRVPSLLGYQHIGCEVTLFPHGKVSISGISTDDVREGAVLTDILPKIKGRQRIF